MEGDGPIMGTPKPMGVLVMGTNLPAVDATAARLMELNPHAIPYLAEAGTRLGPIAEAQIEQRGETIQRYAKHFSFPAHPHFQQFRPSS